MPKFTVTVSDWELEALKWDIYNVQDWIQNAISEKARRTIETLIEQNTDRNPRKVSKLDKERMIRNLDLESAKERTDRMEREFREELQQELQENKHKDLKTFKKKEVTDAGPQDPKKRTTT